MDASWSYYKVYLGRYTPQMDFACVRLAKELQEKFAPQEWFFLRYADTTGPHLRFRWKDAPDGAARAPAFETVVEDLLCEMVYTPPSTYRPLVNLGHAPPAPAEGRSPQAFAYRDDYRPEFEPFRGPDYIDVAHGLFQGSSEVAVSILGMELDGGPSRKSLAPALMRRVLDALVPRAEHEEFLEGYLRYWTVQDGINLDYLTPDFEAKAMELLDQGYDLEPGELECQAVLKRWEEGLAEAAQRYGDLLPDHRLFPDNLPFRFMHLMNNRLGVGILDEAYLAAVLKAYVSRGR